MSVVFPRKSQTGEAVRKKKGFGTRERESQGDLKGGEVRGRGRRGRGRGSILGS